MSTPFKIYLSGPEVFLPDATAILTRKQNICRLLGWEGLSPLDSEFDAGGLLPSDVALAIYNGNVEMMDLADAIIANITPFRGPHMDPGTAFELGYMIAQGKPAMVYTQQDGTVLDRVSNWSGRVDQDETGVRDRNGHLVEDFGMRENLMIEAGSCSDEANPRALLVEPVHGPVFACDRGFQAAAKRLFKLINNS